MLHSSSALIAVLPGSFVFVKLKLMLNVVIFQLHGNLKCELVPGHASSFEIYMGSLSTCCA